MAGRFDSEYVNAVNQYRARHGVPALRFSNELSQSAQAWAQKLAQKNERYRGLHLEHSSSSWRKFRGQPLGENISASSDNMSATNSVNNMYREIRHYNFNRGGFSNATGHFTQMVWKGSQYIGIGRARTSDGRYFIVAHFYPAGNYQGQFRQNVFPPRY